MTTLVPPQRTHIAACDRIRNSMASIVRALARRSRHPSCRHRRVNNDLGAALRQLRSFLAPGGFARAGAVITDLDGTAVLEREGRICLPPEIELGLKRVHDLGRPVIANTLRFPLSVIRVFGAEWHRATGTHLPLVSMKGSQIGRVVTSASGETSFEEWHAETLERRRDRRGAERRRRPGGRRASTTCSSSAIRATGPRASASGRRTPRRIEAVRAKYLSASAVSLRRRRRPARGAARRADLHAVPADRRAARPPDGLPAHQSGELLHPRRGEQEAAAPRRSPRTSASISASRSAPATPRPTTSSPPAASPSSSAAAALDYKGLRDTVRVEGIAALGALLSTVGDSLE